MSYRPGEDSSVEVTVLYDGEQIVCYETNSRPWDEGLVQVRNVIAMNLDEYSRAEALQALTDTVPSHEAELREVFK